MICPNCGTKLFIWVRLKGGGAFEYRARCGRCEDVSASAETVAAIAEKFSPVLQKELNPPLESVTG